MKNYVFDWAERSGIDRYTATELSNLEIGSIMDIDSFFGIVPIGKDRAEEIYNKALESLKFESIDLTDRYTVDKILREISNATGVPEIRLYIASGSDSLSKDSIINGLASMPSNSDFRLLIKGIEVNFRHKIYDPNSLYGRLYKDRLDAGEGLLTAGRWITKIFIAHLLEAVHYNVTGEKAPEKCIINGVYIEPEVPYDEIVRDCDR